MIFPMNTPYARFAVAKEQIWNGMPYRERQILHKILAQGDEDLYKVLICIQN